MLSHSYEITCSSCFNTTTVYHMDWTAIICSSCQAEVSNPVNNPDLEPLVILPSIKSFMMKISDAKFVSWCSVTDQFYTWNGIDTLVIYNEFGMLIASDLVPALTECFDEYSFTDEHQGKAEAIIRDIIRVRADDYKQWLIDMEDEEVISYLNGPT